MRLTMSVGCHESFDSAYACFLVTPYGRKIRRETNSKGIARASRWRGRKGTLSGLPDGEHVVRALAATNDRVAKSGCIQRGLQFFRLVGAMVAPVPASEEASRNRPGGGRGVELLDKESPGRTEDALHFVESALRVLHVVKREHGHSAVERGVREWHPFREPLVVLHLGVAAPAERDLSRVRLEDDRLRLFAADDHRQGARASAHVQKPVPFLHRQKSADRREVRAATPDADAVLDAQERREADAGLREFHILLAATERRTRVRALVLLVVLRGRCESPTKFPRRGPDFPLARGTIALVGSPLRLREAGEEKCQDTQ